MKQKILFILLLYFSTTAVWADPDMYDYSDQSAAIYFESIKNNPHQLYDFLYKMPKGGNLHTHPQLYDALLGVLSTRRFKENQRNNLLPYVAFRVPISLSSGDEVRMQYQMTKELFRTVTNYKITYTAIKNIIRNSLTYSSLQGKQLWLDTNYLFKVPACAQDSPAEAKANLSDLCHAYLEKNEKAALQWQLEERFDKFEEKYVF